MNNCPYCQENLVTPIKRKANCPKCGNTIFIRNGLMVSEYQANKIDWIKRIDWIGINDQMIDNSKNELAARFKQDPSFNDICWHILNKLLLTNMKKPEKLKCLYLEMGRILEIEGKDNKEIIAKANRIDLLESKRNGVTFIQTTNCNDDFVCDNCKKMAEEQIPIDVALETDPIPYRCNNKYCRCWYLL